jgi:hypothetical protein
MKISKRRKNKEEIAMLFDNTNEEALAENAGAKYIEETFGQIILDEKAVAIKQELIESIELVLFDMNDTVDFINRIAEAGFSRNTNEMLVEMVYEAFLISGQEPENINEASALLEYAGNEEKNKQFVKSLKQLEQYIVDFHDYGVQAFAVGDEFIKIMEPLKKLKDDDKGRKEAAAIGNRIQNALDNYNGRIKDGNDKFSEHYRNFAEFKRLAKKFNNKFSNITINDKKALDKKLDELINATLTNPKIKAWVQLEQRQPTPQYDKLVALFDDFKRVDRQTALKILNETINPYLQYQWSVLRQVIGFTNYVRKLIGSENDKKLSYKIVNKILK